MPCINGSVEPVLGTGRADLIAFDFHCIIRQQQRRTRRTGDIRLSAQAAKREHNAESKDQWLHHNPEDERLGVCCQPYGFLRRKGMENNSDIGGISWLTRGRRVENLNYYGCLPRSFLLNLLNGSFCKFTHIVAGIFQGFSQPWQGISAAGPMPLKAMQLEFRQPSSRSVINLSNAGTASFASGPTSPSACAAHALTSQSRSSVALTNPAGVVRPLAKLHRLQLRFRYPERPSDRQVWKSKGSPQGAQGNNSNSHLAAANSVRGPEI